MKRILVIEDDEEMRLILKTAFENAGFSALEAEDGKSGLEQAVLNMPDVIVLDLYMPGVDGKEVCIMLKNNPKTKRIPLIILTGRADICEEAESFNIGADDYITKPFQTKALIARVEKAMRTMQQPPSDSASPKSPRSRYKIHAGKVELDVVMRALKVDGRNVTLTPTEFNILSILMRNQGKIVSRKDLWGQVWHEASPQDKRLADVHINNIRKKLGPHQSYLQTRYGSGYSFKKTD